MDFWSVLLTNLDTNLLVFARIMGIFAFNPLLSRRNIPSIVRVMVSLAITAAALTAIDVQPVVIGSAGEFAVLILKEMLIGVTLGFITQLFLSSTLLSGEIMDMQSGLGMAKIYDPASGVQMPLMGSITSYMLYLMFFASNAHMTYIRLFVISFDIIPIGYERLNPNLGMSVMNYFAAVLVLGLKLAMPMLAAQIIMEICVGILMKAVPQIQVMVVNMQMKLLFGLFLAVVLCPVFANFLDGLLDMMNDAVANVMTSMTV